MFYIITNSQEDTWTYVFAQVIQEQTTWLILSIMA